jgi:hypothetical protein
MHTATQLRSSMFNISLAGNPGTLDTLFPRMHVWDRFGIIVTEPFGSLGASLLIQAAITALYDARREQGPVGRLYPEIYLFHVGGRHGEHSAFDFWPPRKELFLGRDPRELLAALNDRAISRLAVPDGVLPGAKIDWQDGGKERASARDRIVSIFRYSSSGQVQRPDMTIASADANTELNVHATLSPEESLRTLRATLASDTAANDPDDVEIMRCALAQLTQRVDEVSIAERLAITARRRPASIAGARMESYRRIDIDEGLQLLTAISSPATPQSAGSVP